MNSLYKFLIFAFMTASCVPVFSQQQDRFFSTTGTSWVDQHERNWAWLSFLTNNENDLKDRSMAVFAKSGDFDSPQSYELQSVIQLQTSPLVIGVLIDRARNIGGDPALLRSDVEAVFRDFDLDPTLTDAELLTAIIQGSVGDDESFANLMLLARKHPALGLATGIAHLAPIGAGFTSFEIREWDAENGEAGAVLGRVKVEAGNPRILPAPVNLASVEETSPRANLNTRFRWEKPDELKRLSLLHFGFDVYRMTDVFAEAKGYDAERIGPDTLQKLLQDFPDDVVKVNRLPVLIPGNDDGSMAFFVDDNTTVGDGTTPLVDGDSYYYFVAARDVLGRPGNVSEGLKLLVCDKYPPTPPRDIRVERQVAFNAETGVREQNLRIRWRQNLNDSISEYYVYRWNATTDPGFRRDDPENPKVPIGVVPHVPGETFNEFIDETLGEDDLYVSYLYTVRALDSSACGPNLSGHSGFEAGGIVQFDNPEEPEIDLTIRCLQITALAKDAVESVADLNDVPYSVDATRSLALDHVRWVEVRWSPVDDVSPEALAASDLLGRFYYGQAEEVKTIRIPAPGDVPVSVFVRYGKSIEKFSDWASSRFVKSDQGSKVVFNFEAQEDYVLQAPNDECRVHEIPPVDPDDPDPGPDSDPGPDLGGNLPPNAIAWRFYQQINDGPRILIGEGASRAGAILDGLPQAQLNLTCARIRFYLQSVSEGEIESVMDRTVDIFMGQRPPPVPEVYAPRSQGTLEAPKVRIRWYAPPYGIEDFMVFVGMPTQPPSEISPDLSENQLPPGSRMPFLVNGEEVELYAGAYMTGRAGVDFGTPGSGEFEVELSVAIGQRVTMAVQARSRCGEGEISDAVQFSWMGPQTIGPEVPWPARPLPELGQASDYPNMQSVWLPENDQTAPYTLNQLGIRVGLFPWKEIYDGQTPGKGEGFTFDSVDKSVESFLLGGLYDARPLFPMVVYRRQVESPKFKDVSGDVVQVTPLIEYISSQWIAPADLILRDPFFVALPELGSAVPDRGEIYLKDTQPVVRGASYQHFVVLFNERYEPERVIALDPVEVPE